VTGLTNGTSYTFTATATNGDGTSVASAASTAVTPLGDLLLNEPFTGTTLSNPGDWISMRGGWHNEWPCLTAATASVSAANGTVVEACRDQKGSITDNGAVDFPEGALRLTRKKIADGIENRKDATGSLLYNAPLSPSGGIDISFSIRMTGGNHGDVADGVSFFLKDGSNVNNSVGTAGGALGYGMDAGSGNGIPGALLGIGFDKHGNFSSMDVAGASGCASQGMFGGNNPTAVHSNMLVVRGPDTSVSQDGTNGYCFLTRIGVTYADNVFQRVRVVVAPYTPGLPTTVSVYLAPSGTPTTLPASPTLTQTVTISATSFKFGFSAAHGWNGNNHDLRGLTIRTAGQPLWEPLTAVASNSITGSGTGPTSGGTVLTITATGISANPSVTIDGQQCINVSVYAGGTELTCETPPGSLGTKQVVVSNVNGVPGYGTFTYVSLPTPDVTGVNPTSGSAAGGNTLTITGSNFAAGATVSVGNQPCTPVTIVSATTLTCVAPAGTAGTTVDIAVTNVGTAAGIGAELYTYRNATVPPPPSVTTAPSTTVAPSTTAPPATTVPPSTVAPATTVPAPVPADPDTGVLPQVAPGAATVTENGVAVPVELVIEDRTDLVLRGQDFVLRLRGECADGCEVTADANGRETIELESDGAARVSGEGFLPGTPVYVWLFSDPRFLGEFTVRADGTFEGRVPLTGVEVGTHTLQVNGTSFDGVMRSANLGVVVAPAAVPSPGDALLPATGGSGSGATLAVLLTATGAALMGFAGRRRLTVPARRR
jgi:hypothetical protein